MAELRKKYHKAHKSPPKKSPKKSPKKKKGKSPPKKKVVKKGKKKVIKRKKKVSFSDKLQYISAPNAIDLVYSNVKKSTKKCKRYV